MADDRYKGHKAAITSDGSTIRFTFVRSDGTETTLSIATQNLADFILGLETQAGDLIGQYNASLKVTDRRQTAPIRKRTVTKIQGGSSQGNPILSLELDGRLPLDMVLPRDQSQALIEWLQGLQSLEYKAPPKAN